MFSRWLFTGVISGIVAGWWFTKYVFFSPLPLAIAVYSILQLFELRHAERSYLSSLKSAAKHIATQQFTRPTQADDPDLDRIGAEMASRHEALLLIQRRKEQAEMAFDAVFDALYGPAIQVDRDGIVQRINRSVSSIFQISKEEATGRPFLHVVRDHRVEEALRESLDECKSVSVDVEVVAAKHPGRYRVRIEPMQQPSAPGVHGAAVLLFDVSRLRFLERVRSEFVSNISHELRTPITAVKGFIETILEEELPQDERDRFTRIVKEEVDRLESLLVDLLDLSLLESDNKPLKREQIEIAPLVENILTVLQPQADKKDIHIDDRIPSGLPPIPVNKQMIEQAVYNLVENAIKYTGPGGSVQVEARRVAGDHFELSVTDNGPGIPSEHLPRIFERFHRVDQARTRSEGGTGLGLAIVRHIIQRHGGSVRAESRLGKGSRFIVTLPLTPTLPQPTEWEE